MRGERIVPVVRGERIVPVVRGERIVVRGEWGECSGQWGEGRQWGVGRECNGERGVIMTFYDVYDVCRIMRFVGYDIYNAILCLSHMTFVAYDVCRILCF